MEDLLFSLLEDNLPEDHTFYSLDTYKRKEAIELLMSTVLNNSGAMDIINDTIWECINEGIEDAVECAKNIDC